MIKKIGIETAKGIGISSLINQVKTNTGLTIDGNNTATSIQGTANFVNLKEDGEKFKDPITKQDYLFSYSIGGTGTGAYKFTQASTVNEETNTAVVKGNYYEMLPGDSESITVNEEDYYVVDGGVDLPYEISELISSGTGETGVCGKDTNKHLYITPTRLCDSGTASSVTDGGILGDYTWTCGTKSCSGRHAFAWNYNPTDIRDIFGNRSIYTENWDTNLCNPSTMSIVDLTPGTDVIPTTLADNTIYRLSAGNYIQNSTINVVGEGLTSRVFSSCSGLIGIGNVTFYTGDRVDNTILLANNIIITGIKFDGINNGIGGAHASGLSSWPWTNKNKLFVNGRPAENITLNNLDIYNFAGTFDIYGYSTLNKLNIYNNGIGLDVRYAWGSIITNINSYNNSGYGIYTDGIDSVFSNIKSFNNGNGGVLRYDDDVSYNNIISFNNTDGIRYVSYGLLNNIYSYNNTGYGFKIDGEYTNINNIYSYNNDIGFNSAITPDNTYLYGNIKLFGNTSSNFIGDTIPFGTSSVVGFSDGTIIDTTGTYSSSWAVEPSTAGWNINTKGKQSLTFTSGTTYTYGANIGNQTQPIRYNPVTNIPELWGVDGVHYDSTKKVGEW